MVFVVLSDACKFSFQPDDGHEGCWGGGGGKWSMNPDFGYVETFLLWFEDVSASMAFAFVVFDENLNQHFYIDLMDGNLLEPVQQMFRDQTMVFATEPWWSLA